MNNNIDDDIEKIIEEMEQGSKEIGDLATEITSMIDDLYSSDEI